jgi:secondary thiamine-phosphate synthase enzyme
MQEFDVETAERLSVVDITDRVEGTLSGTTSGTATVFVRHTTAAVTVNEAESHLLGDFETALADLVPDSGWAHDALDGNADAHVRAMLVGPGVTVSVESGSLALGTWQSILFVECQLPASKLVGFRAVTAVTGPAPGQCRWSHRERRERALARAVTAGT